MKRFVSLFLCALLVLGMISGCSGGGAGEEGKQGETAAFSVGYGKADISPEKPVHLVGYGEEAAERMSTGVSDRLYGTCVAFSDADGETVLFIATDLLMISKAQSDSIRRVIEKETGVPFDHVILHSSHNHSGPDPSDPVYYQFLQEQLLEAAKNAMADRSPAQMYTAFSRPEGYNFVRHYLLADGKYIGEGVGAVPREDLVGHTTVADNLLQLVKFTRESGKDIIMMNWQGHPLGTAPYSHTTATCNYAGIMRQTVEQTLDCNGVFVLGGSGNLNNNSQIPSEVQYDDYLQLGKALGEEAVKAADSFKQVRTGNIELIENIITRDSGTFGTGSQLPLYAFSIGEVAFAAVPFEIFDTNAVAVKEASKYPMTFYASCTNGYYGYLPTPKPFDYYAYEVRVTYFAQGTAEYVQNELIGMLDSIFAASGNEETEKDPGYITPEFVPSTDGAEYINPTPGNLSACTEVENGFYQIYLLQGTTMRKMLTLNKEVAEKVLAQTTVKLLFNEQNVIVDIVS